MPPRTRSAKATTSSAAAPAAAPAAPPKAPAKKRGKAAAAVAPTDPDPVATNPTNATDPGDDEEEDKPKQKSTRARKRAKDDEDEEDDVVKPSKKKAKVDDDDDDDDVDANDAKDAKDDDKKEEPKKMVKVLKRGKAPVDIESAYVLTHQVYAKNEDVYDAMLNQSSIQRNNNKCEHATSRISYPRGLAPLPTFPSCCGSHSSSTGQSMSSNCFTQLEMPARSTSLPAGDASANGVNKPARVLGDHRLLSPNSRSNSSLRLLPTGTIDVL